MEVQEHLFVVEVRQVEGRAVGVGQGEVRSRVAWPGAADVIGNPLLVRAGQRVPSGDPDDEHPDTQDPEQEGDRHPGTARWRRCNVPALWA